MPSKTIEEQRVKLDEEKQRHANKLTHQERKLSLKELIPKWWKETFVDGTNPADGEKKRK
jgi:hypothetical protein